MAKFVYVYTGGTMASTPEAQEAAMQAWGAWFGKLGEAVVDGGNPFGASAAVHSGGRSAEVSAKATGYSIVTADSLDDAAMMAETCPVLSNGGTVEVYEAIPM